MKTLEFPMICWQMDEDSILGNLVGYDHQMIGKDLRKLKVSFTDFVEKKLKRGEYIEPFLGDAHLKIFPVKIRPHYQEAGRLYPTPEVINLDIPAVYGRDEYGQQLCILPVMDASFYFYNKRDLGKLVEHFSREMLTKLSPPELYSLLIPGTPWLETFSINSSRTKTRKTHAKPSEPDFPTLLGVAERLPHPRKERVGLVPDQVWERGELVAELSSLLMEENTHTLLVGKPGVGKSAIIQEMIRTRHSQERSNESHERHSFWRTNPARMIAKAKYLGEWQLVCEDVVEELNFARGILWMENFVSMAMTGGEGAEDSMAAFLTPFLRDGKLRMVSEVTPEQLEAMRRLAPGFVEHFRILHIKEMDPATTRSIFEYYNAYTSRNLGINFSPSALDMSYALLDRFVRYDSFPGKAIQFLASCTQAAHLNKKKELHVEDMIDTFSQRTGLPGFLLRDDQLLDGEELSGFFLERIKGQDHVVNQVCSIIKIFKAGLNDPGKPVATLLFAGPTGVGKTAMATALAEYFFGLGQKNRPLIRLDMSEFQHGSQIYRLIGSDGKLVKHVRESPFSVVLLDEIEKANPLIFDALLTVLDEGLLFDAAGRLTDFRNTIIIMTSNLGSSRGSSLGFKSYQDHDYEGDIRSFFRPEFYNRIDQCLIFTPLSAETIYAITLRELEALEKRDGIAQRKLRLEFTPEVIQLIAEIGFDPKYGARPLQREVERLVIAPLARILVEKPELKEQSVKVKEEDRKIVFDLGKH